MPDWFKSFSSHSEKAGMNVLSVSVRCFDVDGSGTDVDCGYPGEGTVGPAQEGKAS